MNSGSVTWKFSEFSPPLLEQQNVEVKGSLGLESTKRSPASPFFPCVWQCRPTQLNLWHPLLNCSVFLHLCHEDSHIVPIDFFLSFNRFRGPFSSSFTQGKIRSPASPSPAASVSIPVDNVGSHMIGFESRRGGREEKIRWTAGCLMKSRDFKLFLKFYLINNYLVNFDCHGWDFWKCLAAVGLGRERERKKSLLCLSIKVQRF